MKLIFLGETKMGNNLKGFFSVFTAALSVFVLVFAATAAISLFDYHQASLADLQAKVLSDKFDDVSKMFNATVEDALLDYTYGTFGCVNAFDNSFCQGGVCSSPCKSMDAGKLARYYLANLSSQYSSSFNISTSVSEDDCGNGNPPNPTIDGIAYRNRTVTLSINVSLNSSGVYRTASRKLTRTILTETAGSVFYLRIRNESNSDLKNLSVVCS